MMYCDFDDRRVCRVNETMAEVSNVLMQERMAGSGCGVVMRRSNNSNPALSQPGQDTFSRLYERSAENTRSNTNSNANTNTSYHRGDESELLSRPEQRHGDLRRQHLAANVIQKAYRSHVFNKSFLDLRNRQRVVGEMYSDTDGTLTLTPHRAAEWHATYEHKHEHEHEYDCGVAAGEGARMRLEISPSSVAQVNDGAQLRQALALNGGAEVSASPVWIRQLDTAGDAFHFEEDDEELCNAATLRAGNRSETSLQEAAGVKERGFSMDRPAGSQDCECEECRMSKRVAQLSVVFFGSDADRAGRSSTPSAGVGARAGGVGTASRATISTGTLRPAAVAAVVKRHEIDRRRKQLYRVGLNLFNRQPEGGMQFLIAAGFVKDEPSCIAHFLLARHGLSRSAIGELLGGALRSVAMGEVLAAVAAQHCFADRPIDVALRSFQSGFQLTGEAQRIQRVVEAFAEQYTAQNDKLLRVKFRTQKRADLVHLMALACLMLNTDLHSPNVRADRKMKPEEFVRNLSGLDDGADLDRASLLEMYERVRAKPFATARDHVAHVRKLETVLIGLSSARPLSLVTADSRQRRKSSANTLLSRQPIRQSSDAGSSSEMLGDCSRAGFVYRFDFSKLALPYRRIVCYCRVFELAESHVRKLFSTGVLHLEVAEGGRVQSRIAQPAYCEDDAKSLHVEQSESQRREVFLFNDSLLITKQNSRSKTKKSGDKPRATSYAFRQIVSLANAHVAPYCGAQTPFGVCIVAPACDVHCAKNACDLYVASVGGAGEPIERSRSGPWQDSSSTSSSHSNLSDRPAPAGLQDVAVLILAAKSSVDCEKFCQDIVESIIETRTMRRVLARLADGVPPADIARAYVPSTATPTLSASPSLTAAIDSANFTRRGSEPIIAMANSNDQAPVPPPGCLALPPNTPWTCSDAPLRHTKLSVSSTSSSSIGTMGTLSATSYDDATSRSGTASVSTSRSQTHLQPQRMHTQRHTVADAGLHMQKQTLLVTPEKAHVLTAADVQQLLRTGSPHQAHAPSTPSPLALTPAEQSDARRSLQFGNKPPPAMLSYTSAAPRPVADIDATVAENGDYLTFGSVPIVRR